MTNHTKDIETNTLGPPFRGQEDQPQRLQPRESVNTDDAEETSNSSVGQYENYSIKLIKTATFQAGKLESCSDKWSTLTPDPHILKIIRGFGIQFSDVPQQAHPQKEFQFSSEETYFLQQEIDRLLTQSHFQISVQWRWFCVQYFSQREKRLRKILHDFKFEEVESLRGQKNFKMDTLKSAINMVTPEC